MTTKQEIKNWGYNHASGIPGNNYKTPFKECIKQGFTWEEDESEILETTLAEFHEAEDTTRLFFPFEFIAKDLNDLVNSKPYDPWEVFKEGIHQYFKEWWKENAENLYTEMYEQDAQDRACA